MAEENRTTLALIEALMEVWLSIRAYHPSVPDVVLLPAPAEKGHGNVLGHFAALRWSTRKDKEKHLHEVVVVAEHLNRPPEDIVETLLHEAAHAANFERGIRDCSRSQYHNRAFKEAAEELGLKVTQVANYGFAYTSLLPATRNRYSEEIKELREVLVHRRGSVTPVKPTGTTTTGKDEDKDGDNTGTRSRSRKATCACPYIIRVSRKTIEDTVIRCESCGQPFQLA